MELKDISKKRQKKWKETDLYKVKEDTSKPKFYILDMFPYPSGSALHVGHPKGFMATDALARKKMLEGFNVLHPMWFDTFGLGTEQYAIEHKMKPQDVAKKNIEKFISQLESFWTTYDRSRAVNTADPKYFKRTQRVFLQMYNHYYDTKLGKALPIKDLELRIKNWEDLSYLSSFAKGGEPLAGEDLKNFLNSQRLAYVDYKPINRCPKCMTGLANEDLDDGKCERCGSEVEQKPMKQRVLRITKYADRLLSWLDDLQRDESMKDLERNWIGKSEGTQFEMVIASDNPTLNPSPLHGEGTRLPRVYTVGKNKLPSWNTMIFLARELRKKQTVPELLLREVLRNKQVNNLKFRRQHPLWNYIADFYCPEKNLVIELDGNIHNKEEQKKRDQERDIIMQQHNINVIRFSNDDIFEKIEEVIQTIIDISNQSPLATEWRGVGGEVTNSLKFSVYTTRIDTVFWMSFVAIAPEHPLLKQMQNSECKIQNWKEIESYQEQAKHKTQLERTELQKDKTWIKIEWISAINPFNGQAVPIFVADYVLANYGTGVVMAVPAHDERDFEFAKKYDLPITNSILPKDKSFEDYDKIVSSEICFTEKWVLNNSWEFSELKSDEAIKKMQAWLEEKWIGGVKVNYRMQDRVFSRQRYRGEPFPVVRDEAGNIIALDEKDLPLELPDVENYEPTGTEEWPLANITERVNVTLPDGTKAKRETNTMPGRAGSSRYWLRYMDVNNENELVGKEKEKYRGSVDVYVGGAEHITRHMIYGRFWQKFLFDIGAITHEEPFQEYHSVGLIMGEDGRKMSKRRGNVVNPDDIIDEFGTDVLRAYEMFMGPFEQSIAWSTNGIKGIKKFLDKIIALKDKISDAEETNETKIILNQSIKKLTEDIDGFRFNTAISQLMILVNHLTECTTITKKTFEDLIILVSPFAPHLAEELREQLGNDYSVFTKATWPTYDEKCLVADTVTIAVQVNGKVRWTICISKEAEEKEVMELAKSDEKIQTRITGEPKKVIYVKGKILNIVIA